MEWGANQSRALPYIHRMYVFTIDCAQQRVGISCLRKHISVCIIVLWVNRIVLDL